TGGAAARRSCSTYQTPAPAAHSNNTPPMPAASQRLKVGRSGAGTSAGDTSADDDSGTTCAGVDVPSVCAALVAAAGRTTGIVISPLSPVWSAAGSWAEVARASAPAGDVVLTCCGPASSSPAVKPCGLSGSVLASGEMVS